MESWNETDVKNWLTKNSLEEFVPIVKVYALDGDMLGSLDPQAWSRVRKELPVSDEKFEEFLRLCTAVYEKEKEFIQSIQPTKLDVKLNQLFLLIS